MPPNKRPDAIVQAQMPVSAFSRPSTPVLVGVGLVIVVLALVLIFLFLVPEAALHSGEQYERQTDANLTKEMIVDDKTVEREYNFTPASTQPPSTGSNLLSDIEGPLALEEEAEQNNT